MLVPILLLAVLPLGYFAARTGLQSRFWARPPFLAKPPVTNFDLSARPSRTRLRGHLGAARGHALLAARDDDGRRDVMRQLREIELKRAQGP